MRKIPIICRYSLVFLLCFCFYTSVKGQSVSLSDARDFNLAILDVFDQYERSSSLTEKSDSSLFVSLFSDINKKCVYNDLLGSKGYQTMVTPFAYLKAYPIDGSVIVQSSLSNISKAGDIYVENGLLHRKIACSKYLMLIDSNVFSDGEGGVLFDSSELYKDDPDFRLIFDFSYSPETKECKISSISAEKEKSHSPLDEDSFSVITKSSDKYDSYLKTRGNQISFNEFNQSFAYRDDIEMTHPDIIATPVEYNAGRRYNVIGFIYRPIFMRAKVYSDFAIGGSYRVVTSQEDIVKAKSGGFDLGVDIGFERPVSPNWKIGLYGGVGFNRSKITLMANDVQYDFELRHLGIKRHYSFSAEESLTLLDLFVPLYLELEINLGRRMVIDLDLGAKGYLNMKTTLSPYSVFGSFGGSHVEESYTSFYYPEKYNRRTYDITPFARIEFDYGIIKNRLYAYASYGFDMAFVPSYESALNQYLVTYDNIYPFFYSIIQGKDIPSRSLIGTVSYTRSSNLISFGLKLKY